MKKKLDHQDFERYQRQIRLEEVGQSGQEAIKNARVLCIGAGGLGTPALQYLSAAGVGQIGIMDGDLVEKSNLHRQVLYDLDDLGKNKATVMAEKLQKINPLIHVHAYPYHLKTDNALEIFKQYDIILDGSDNFETRYLTNDAAILCDKPLVYAAIYKFEGQLSVFNYNQGPTYRCLFPDPPSNDSVPNCAQIGVLGVLPGIFGLLQANEVLKIILEFEDVLCGKLMIMNTRTLESNFFSFDKNEALYKTVVEKTVLHQSDYEFNCEFSENKVVFQEINSIDKVEKISNCVILDVREPWEQPRINHQAVLEIPLPRVLEKHDSIPKDKPVVVVCNKGIRSKIAIEQLYLSHQYSNLINLKDGLEKQA